MTKLAAIGGGYNGGDFDQELEQILRSFTPKECPKVIFIPYAAENYNENYHEFENIYHSFGCEVRLLQPGLESQLLDADIIYLGRGWTLPLIQKLQETGAVQFLRQAMKRGAIIAGFSAGAHALFTYAGSDEGDIGFTLVEGLGLINGCLNTHYNYEERAKSFNQLLIRHRLNGIGLSDHTMLIVDTESLAAQIYSTKESFHGFFIQNQESELNIQVISNKPFILRDAESPKV